MQIKQDVTDKKRERKESEEIPFIYRRGADETERCDDNRHYAAGHIHDDLRLVGCRMNGRVSKGYDADMGLVDEVDAGKLIVASAPWFIDVMKRGLYKGWVVEQNGQIVAGGGLHLSEIGPLPGSFRVGRSAHIANVYTHAEHRKRDAGRSRSEEMLRWCQESGIDQVTLTASKDGRAPLYLPRVRSATGRYAAEIKPAIAGQAS